MLSCDRLAASRHCILTHLNTDLDVFSIIGYANEKHWLPVSIERMCKGDKNSQGEDPLSREACFECPPREHFFILVREIAVSLEVFSI
jgi:hypothetical protein